jgi:hypothetical protein
MADPLACTTEPKVAITNLVLRDVEIRGGYTPNVFLCDAAVGLLALDLTTLFCSQNTFNR